MVDTVRTLAALQALLADNTDGDISAQDVRDFLVSVFPPQFSGARAFNSGTQNNIDGGGADVPLAIDSALFDTDSYFNAANNSLDAPSDGYYLATGSMVLLETNNLQQGHGDIQVNGTDEAGIWFLRSIGSSVADDRIGFNGSAVLSLSAGDAVRLTVSCITDGAVDDIDISTGSVSSNLTLVRLGQTPA